jgi:hypothetical protein
MKQWLKKYNRQKKSNKFPVLKVNIHRLISFSFPIPSPQSLLKIGIAMLLSRYLRLSAHWVCTYEIIRLHSRHYGIVFLLEASSLPQRAFSLSGHAEREKSEHVVFAQPKTRTHSAERTAAGSIFHLRVHGLSLIRAESRCPVCPLKRNSARARPRRKRSSAYIGG